MTEQAKLEMGMSYATVVTILGEPTAIHKGAETLSGEGTVVASSETRSRLFHTNYCFWIRPEGEYMLTFEFGRLTDVHKAPEGAVTKLNSSTNRTPRMGLIILVVFAERPSNIDEAARKIMSDADIQLVEGGIVECFVDRDLAVDTTEEGRWSFLIAQEFRLLKTRGLREENIDMDNAKKFTFRTTEGSNQSNAGIIFVVPPQITDTAG